LKIFLLTAQHELEAFDCGDPVRNAWLKTRAVANASTDDTRTYVAIESDEIVGFYALTTASILRASLPGALRRNAPDPVACLLLAQFAIDKSRQGQGFSRPLMLHAWRQTAKIADLAGCRLLILHPARPELIGYYEKFGFTQIETTPLPIMAISLQKIRALLANIS